MKRIIFFLITALISVSSFSQVDQKVSTPYQYRWFITDSALGIPYGATSVLRRTSQLTRPAYLFWNTTDSTLKAWTGTQFIDAVRSSASYTDADARSAISLTTTGTSGAATYNSGTGVFNIPQYSGTTNANVGAFYRWLKPATQEIKTFANGYGLLLDSTTNTDALTATVDTFLISTRAWRDKLADSLGALISGAGGVSGLTSPRIPYASSATTLTDNDRFYRIVDPGIQGDGGATLWGPLSLGGHFNLSQNRNFDYVSNGLKAYQLEVIYDGSSFDTDSISMGALAVTAYGNNTGGNSIHSRKARGTQTSPTQILTGDRTLSIGAKGYTNANYFSNSSIAILGEATENYTATGWGSKMIFETTLTGSTVRSPALTLNNDLSAVFGSSMTTTTTGTIGTNLNVTNYTHSPILYGSTGAGGDLTIEGTSNASKSTASVFIQPTGGNVTIGTSTPAGIFTTQASANDIRWQMNNTDVTLPSYSAVGFTPSLATGTVFMVAPFSGTSGGVQLFGLTESGANTMSPISMVGYHGGTSPTAAGLRFTASKHNGTTGTTSLAASEIIAQFQNNGTTMLATLLGNGNFGIGTVAPDRLLHPEISDATTNSIVYPFRMSHTTSATAAIGGGVGMEMETENASGTMRVTGSVTNPMTDATNATEDADYTINLIRAGTLTEGFRVTSVGGVTVNGAAGTAGQILTSGGTGAASTWTTPTTRPTLTKNMTLESPTSSENFELLETPVAITITNVKVVLVGSGSPSVTYNLAFDADRSVAGTNVFTAGQTVTSTTTGTAASSGFNDATIPAGSYIRLTTSALTDATRLQIRITYTED